MAYILPMVGRANTKEVKMNKIDEKETVMMNIEVSEDTIMRLKNYATKEGVCFEDALRPLIEAELKQPLNVG